MQTGAITSYVDVAQLTLYAFWIFFAILIWYLHRENKREGYPLESSRDPNVKREGWPRVPKPKTYKLPFGRTAVVPNARDWTDRAPVPATSAGGFSGAPLVPTGNPFVDNVGPGSWNPRSDEPDVTMDNEPKIVPLRLVADWNVAMQDIDPRGLTVYGADRRAAGTVRDLWVDRSEVVFRYLEVEVVGGRRVLVPMNFTRITQRGVHVQSILGSQFAGVPSTKYPDRLTLRDEDKIAAYFGAGTLYATPSRSEPLL